MNTEKETKLTTRKALFIMAMDLIVVIMKLLSLLLKILYLIFNYPHKHYTFKHFEVQKNTHLTTNLPRLNEP